MGFVKDLAKEFINRHKEAGSYDRHQIIQRDLKGVKLKMMKKLVHYFYHKDKKVSARTEDRLYLWKLVAWAIIERSKNGLDKTGLAALLEHRKAVIEKGPNPEASLMPSPVFAKRFKRRKERKIQMAVKEKAKGKEKSDVLKFEGNTFKLNHKFKLKENAEHSKNFKKKGPRRTAAMLFTKGLTFEAAIEAAKKAFKDDVKASKLNDFAEDNVKHALNRLSRFNLLEGQDGPKSFPAPKKAKDEEKKSSKAEAKKKGKDKEEDDEDEDDEDEPKAKKNKKSKVKAKAKAKAKDEEDEEDDDEEDDEEDDDEEDEDD